MHDHNYEAMMLESKKGNKREKDAANQAWNWEKMKPCHTILIIELFVPDNSVDLSSLTPKKLMAYKSGMAFKKAMALAAFQQIPADEDDFFIQSSLPQTIAEEEMSRLPSGKLCWNCYSSLLLLVALHHCFLPCNGSALL